ncbi:MAG: response regulator [Microscillaceae bacterium]|nr:response regulator [Microscillaceae bacterium]
MKTANLTLVVEDDEITSFLIQKTLSKSNVFKEILSFENGQPALVYLQEALAQLKPIPDLILLDINMPIMDGWELLDALQELHFPNHIPVVMLTSSINEEDRRKAKTYKNVQGYFTKPLTEKYVEELVKLLH